MQQFISRDAIPSNPFVTATVSLSISDEEMKRNHLIELYDLKFNNKRVNPVR